MDLIIDTIEIQDDKFIINLIADTPDGDDATITIEQSDLFDKIKNAFRRTPEIPLVVPVSPLESQVVVPITGLSTSISNCQTCISFKSPTAIEMRNIAGYPHPLSGEPVKWWCLKFPEKQDNCSQYELIEKE
jgi:hypothetical protein